MGLKVSSRSPGDGDERHGDVRHDLGAGKSWSWCRPPPPSLGVGQSRFAYCSRLPAVSRSQHETKRTPPDARRQVARPIILPQLTMEAALLLLQWSRSRQFLNMFLEVSPPIGTVVIVATGMHNPPMRGVYGDAVTTT
jgi:hypothetical protein